MTPRPLVGHAAPCAAPRPYHRLRNGRQTGPAGPAPAGLSPHRRRSLGGSKVSVRTDAGYVLTVIDASGKTRVMTSNLQWDIVCDAPSGKWYFHTIDPANQVDISTMSITKA
jgi:hypothetical protein